MPKVRLTDTYRVASGVSIPGAEPSVRVRGEFVHVSTEDVKRLKRAIEKRRAYSDLTLENLEVRNDEGAANSDVSGSLKDAVGETTAEKIRSETGAETLSEIQALADDALLSVTGIGPETLKKLRSADSGDGGGGS